jgi:ATP-binding cassette subfamily F protein 2
LLDKLHKDEIAVTYEAKRGGQHANARDINVGGVSVTFHGRPLIEETEIVINYGNRYGFIGPNGSGECWLIMFTLVGAFFPCPQLLTHQVFLLPLSVQENRPS